MICKLRIKSCIQQDFAGEQSQDTVFVKIRLQQVGSDEKYGKGMCERSEASGNFWSILIEKCQQSRN